MKQKKLLLLTMTILALGACRHNNEPKFVETDSRIIGEWERLDKSNQPNTFITDSQVILSNDIVIMYKLIETGKLYARIPYLLCVWTDSNEFDTTQHVYDAFCPYQFDNDTLTIYRIKPANHPYSSSFIYFGDIVLRKVVPPSINQAVVQ